MSRISTLVCEARQRFREAHNRLDALTAPLVTTQQLLQHKKTLESAQRRRVGSTSSRVAAAPLGLLVAFPDSTVELLIGKHQQDINALLHSIATSVASWSGTLRQVRALVGEMDAMMCHNNGNNNTAEYEILSSHTSLTTCTEAHVALHGLLAAITKMESLLVEGLAALRLDIAAATQSPHAHAYAVAAYMWREAKCQPPSSLVVDAASSSSSSPTTTTTATSVAAAPLHEGSLAIGLAPSSMLMNVGDAIAELAEFWPRQWALLRAAHLPPSSMILLAS